MDMIKQLCTYATSCSYRCSMMKTWRAMCISYSQNVCVLNWLTHRIFRLQDCCPFTYGFMNSVHWTGNSSITSLQLYHPLNCSINRNAIGDRGAVELAAGLRINHSLQNLKWDLAQQHILYFHKLHLVSPENPLVCTHWILVFSQTFQGESFRTI